MTADKKRNQEPKEDAELEKRVDAMMDPHYGEKKVPAPKEAPEKDAPAEAPIDIFNDSKTAPEVSPQLLEKIGVKPKKDAEEADEAATESAPSGSVVIPESSAIPEPAPGSEKPAADIESPETDKAVDDIVANEGDLALAAQDNQTARSEVPAEKPRKKRRLHVPGWLKTKKGLAGLLVVVLLLMLAVPFTRYKALGLVIKQSMALTVVDSKTATPVSNALVSGAGLTAKTDANGKTKLRVPYGPHTLTITKEYYRDGSVSVRAGFGGSTTEKVSLAATGRQVPISVVSGVTGKPLANATITVLKTTAKTDAKGRATVVLPADSAKDDATVSLSGYNTLHAAVQVTAKVVPENIIHLTPSGQVYFLSNLNGTIDVVKSNLDGSGRKTVLAGTGKEDNGTTSLLASRDWHYLVLKARRDTTDPALYLIDTTRDKVTQFDTGAADFNLIGWYGHDFTYDIVRNDVSAWKSGHEQIKSYDADHLELNQLDQNQAEGDANAYSYQGFYNFYITDDLITYNTQWYTGGSTYPGPDLNGKNNTIRAVQPGGQNKKDYQSFSAQQTSYFQAVLASPATVYYSAFNNTDNKTTFYKFENGGVTPANNLDSTAINKQYPTYLLSPSGNQTLWTELRDGKNAIFTGDATAQHKTQVASLEGYTPYGWYGDGYVLLQKSNSELYIMSSKGQAIQPLKITDYYKPAQTFSGYGYGYGGL
jgi:hypothetical protein